MQNSLHRPHDPDPRDGDNFSTIVADALDEAYRTIKLHHGGLPGQLAAQDLVSPVAGLRMSPRQRMQVYYVQATAALAQGLYHECASLLGAADRLAFALPDPLAGAELAYLRAATEVMRHEYAQARAHYLRSLELLITARGDDLAGPSPDPEIEASAILGVAGCAFLAAHYADAERYVELAQSLLAPAPRPVTAATLVWLRAALDRWRGETERALRAALAAAEAFRAANTPGSTGQLLLLAALCALDLAEPSSGQGAGETSLISSSWLTMAQPLIERTLQHARATADDALEGHALLAKVRYGRLAGSPTAGRMGLLVAEAVIVRSERLRDPVLRCEGLTERGHQFVARHNLEAATAAYHEALEQARAHGVDALGTWAQRAMEHLSR